MMMVRHLLVMIVMGLKILIGSRMVMNSCGELLMLRLQVLIEG